MRERFGELMEDLGWALERARRRIGRGPKPPPPDGRPSRLRLWLRRLTALVVLGLALFAAFRFVPVPGLSCTVSPAKECATPDDAIALVPADAYAYLHLSLDPDSGQLGDARELTRRLPNFDAIAEGTLRALGLPPGIELQRDVAGWVGEELAFAQLGPGAPRPLALLSVDEPRGAEGFLGGLGRGKPRVSPLNGVDVRVYENGVAGAQLRGFLAVGTAEAVRAAVAAGRGGGRSLGDSAEAEQIREPLPAQRLGDAYVSAAGVQRLLAGRGGVAAQLDTFADYRASRGLAAALVASEEGFKLEVDSALDPKSVSRERSFFQLFGAFEPSLAGELAPDSLLYAGFDDPGASIGALLRQARSTAPALAAAFDRFRRQLRRGGVDLVKEVLPLLKGEAAVGVASARGIPYLSLVFDQVDEGRAREQMARLQGPIVSALRPAQTGQAPSFDAERLGDTVIRSVRLSASLELAYAIFDGKLVVATNPAGVRQAVEGEGDLADSDAYEAVNNAGEGEVSALVFLNLEGLLGRAQSLGLDQIVGGFGADLAKLRALGATVRGEEDNLSTTLFLDIE